MKPVPALHLGSPRTPRAPPSAAARLGLGGRDAGASLQLSARHILKPQVGMSAMRAALGDKKPAWEQPALSPRAAAPPPTCEDKGVAKQPYHVGRARARGELRLALGTLDEAAQLRRLDQALKSPVVEFETALAKDVAKAGDAAAMLSDRLRAQEDVSAKASLGDYAQWAQLLVPAGAGRPARAAAPGAAAAAADAEAEELLNDGEAADAAVKIQCVFRGRKDREEVESRRRQKEEAEEAKKAQEAQEAAELEGAATKIQATFRGKAARSAMAKGADDAAAPGEDQPPETY